MRESKNICKELAERNKPIVVIIYTLNGMELEYACGIRVWCCAEEPKPKREDEKSWCFWRWVQQKPCCGFRSNQNANKKLLTNSTAKCVEAFFPLMLIDYYLNWPKYVVSCFFGNISTVVHKFRV